MAEEYLIKVTYFLPYKRLPPQERQDHWLFVVGLFWLVLASFGDGWLVYTVAITHYSYIHIQYIVV